MTQFRGAHIVAVVALLAAVVQYRGGATGSVVANPEWEAKVSALEAKEGPVLTITDKKGKPHVAEVTQANGIATLSVQHGSTEAHWVGCIYAKDQDGVVIHYEDKPREAAPKPIVSQFKIPDGVTSLVAYEWCNLDGIYKSDIVAVDPAVAAVGAVASTEGPVQTVIAAEQLSRNTGEDGTPIWLVCLGTVYDVSAGATYYGKGTGYSHFAGRDGTAAFVTGDFKTDSEVDGPQGDVSSLTAEQMMGVDHWLGFYRDHEKYQKVGVLHGRYWDAEGRPTPAQAAAMAKIAEGKALKEQQEEQKKKYPSCNMKWAQNSGGEVWCEDATQLPRRMKEKLPGADLAVRCACFSKGELEQGKHPPCPATSAPDDGQGKADKNNLGGGNSCLELYEDCAADALRCNTPA